jgi:large subunit ribosomal protein L17
LPKPGEIGRPKLGRPTALRVALVRNQVAALFEQGYLNTTLPRAKAVQSLAERLITKAKRGDLGSVRQCARDLPTRRELQSLLRRVVPAVQEQKSGYTQIARLKYRRETGR